MPLTDTEFRQLISLLQPSLRDRTQRERILGMAFPNDEKKRNFATDISDPEDFVLKVVQCFYHADRYSSDLVVLIQVIQEREGGDRAQRLQPLLERLQVDKENRDRGLAEDREKSDTLLHAVSVSPSDRKILKTFWKFINFQKIHYLDSEIGYGRLNSDLVGEIGDQYLIFYRTNPEYHLYNKKLEKLLNAFDESLRHLFALTPVVFVIDIDSVRLRRPKYSDLQNLGVKNLEELYSYHEKNYENVLRASENMFQRHDELLQELHRLEILHELSPDQDVK